MAEDQAPKQEIKKEGPAEKQTPAPQKEQKPKQEETSKTAKKPAGEQKPAPKPEVAPEKKEAAPKKKAPEAVEKPANCMKCNKHLQRKTWYYRENGYYCSKRCWKLAMTAKKKDVKAT